MKSDNRSLSILLLTQEQYPSSRIRLTELYEKELTSRGYRISWVMQSRDSCDKEQVLRSGNNEFYLVPSKGQKSVFWRGFNKLLALRKYKIASSLAHNNDIIIANDGVLEGIIGAILQRRHGLPFCFYLSSLFHYFAKANFKENRSILSAINYLLSLPEKQMFDYIIRKCDLFHPISAEMGKQYMSRGVAKRVLPLPICASNEYLNTESNSSDVHERKVIVYIGQISKMRRLDFLIKAFSLLEENIESFSSIGPILRIIGPSFDRKEIPRLTEMAKELGVDYSVEFIDEIAHNSLPNVLKDVALGVSPIPPTKGYIPSTPTKCIEYLSLGIPVVANREIVDQRKVVEESGGGIAPAYELKEFSNAMLRMLTNPIMAKDMGARGRKWIRRNRSYKHLSRSLDSSYRELIKGP